MPESRSSDDTSERTGSYEQLLTLFADDEHLAAERYLLVRAKLVLYFESRRISPSEDYADEVLHRTVQKIADGEQIEDIDRYIYGIAKFVRLESFRRRQMDSLDDTGIQGDGASRPVPAALRVMPLVFDSESDGPMQRCLGQCLANLSQENKELLLNYYAADEKRGTHIEQRKALAKKAGKSAGALQKQICLLRQKVGTCTKDCVRREG